jgi:glucose-1-phosphate cytidylyltransferase
VKTVIICGGKGERLREETEFKPKPLVEIGGRPILYHIMKIYGHYGFKDFILALGYKGYVIKDYFLHLAEMANDFTIKLGPNAKISYFEHEKMEDWNVTFAETGLETLSGGRVARVKRYIGSDEEFFYTYGDGLSNVDIREVLAFHRKMGKTVTIVGINPPSVYGVLEVENGLAKSFKEKPTLDGMINGGFWVCNRRVFDYISTDEKCQFEDEPLKAIAADGQLAVFHHKGYWECMDTYKHVSRLNAVWGSGQAPWKVWA